MRILQKPEQIDLDGLKEKELSLLKIFIEICEKNGLLYFAVGGTCLGAVRHKGFIPWDDDIDVAMPRGDYDKFVDLAQSQLPKNCFLQTHETDKDYRNDYAKIRDSSTTFIETSVAKLHINHGVFIDIFSIDGMPTSQKEINALERHKRHAKRYLAKDYILPENALKKALRKICSLLLHFSTSKILTKLENHYREFPYESSEIVVNHGGAWGEKNVAQNPSSEKGF